MINRLRTIRNLTVGGLLSKNKYSLVILNEYNFYVDFKGVMYFDTGGPISPTNIIKDKKFIHKFYKSLREN